VDPAVWGPEPENRRIRLPAQDREAMAAGKSFAGFRGGNRIQDAAVQLSEGTLYDRSKEHLVPADLAIIRMRRLFADSIRLVAEGGDPLGLGEGCDFARIGAASQIIDADQRWQDLVPANHGVHEPARRVSAPAT
jgi:phthalate 4,5-dioxygenase